MKTKVWSTHSLPKFSFHAALLIASSSALAFGAKAPKSDSSGDNPMNRYLQKSLTQVSLRAGVRPEALRGLFDAIKNTSATQNISSQLIQNCSSKFSSDLESRSEMLNCLSRLGRSALNEELHFSLEEFTPALYKTQHKSESEKSLFLIGLIEDMIRQNRVDQGLAAHWFDSKKGYLPSKTQRDYHYQHGDVMLGMGNTSISSLISHVTVPQSRFSHAFLMKENADKSFSTLEALVETGPREFKPDHFIKDPYNELWLTRWKNSRERANVSSKAVDWASRVAKEKRPYDLKMDIRDDSKIFCSEFIIRALTEATGKSVEDIAPVPSKITNDKIFEYIKRVSVESREIPAPSDMLESPYLEVLAKYRKADDLYREWELFLMGDLFVERLKEGANFDADPLYMAASTPIYALQLFPSLLVSEARLIPKKIGPGTLAVMATTELKLYKPAIKWARKQLNAESDMNLLSTSPWLVRAYYDYWMDNSINGRRHFEIRD